MQTTINWFPGHMTKALRAVEAELKNVDMVWEIRDARLPRSSANPVLDEIIERKQRVVILNKADLADPIATKEWQKKLTEEGKKAFVMEAVNSKTVNAFLREFSLYVEKNFDKKLKKGMIQRTIRAMVVGIPNVGKSSFINTIDKGRQKAIKVGNKPGVTRGKQLIRINEGLELLDMPGVLWPKFENDEMAWKMAATGCINDDVYDVPMVVEKLIGWLFLHKEGKELQQRYSVEAEGDETALQVMEKIGKKRGFLLSGGVTDQERTVKMILQEFRKGLIGRVTLENIDS